MILGDKKTRNRKGRHVNRRVQHIVITALLFSFVLWSLKWNQEQTRIRQAQLDISRIGHAARLFRTDYGRCPVDVKELIDPPEDTPYLTDDKDPWGQLYKITCPSRTNLTGVDVISWGPKGPLSTEDNISSL